MPKEIIFESEARAKILEGVKTLAKTVGITMGPKGRNVIVGKSIGAPVITKDGVSVAREVVLEDPFEELGCQLVKEVAGRTADVAGDGTTTATVLAYEILNEGLKVVENQKANPLHLKRGMEWALKRLTEELDKVSKPITSFKELQDIATVSANNDFEIGSLIAQAHDAVGENGLVTANAYPGIKSKISILKGIELNSGYLSRVFLDNDTNSWDAENCYILICNRDITHLSDATKILESLAKANKPLLIIAKGIKKEAAQILRENSVRGRLRVCAIKIPVFGSNHDMWLEDLAMLVGTKVVDEDYGVSLESLDISDLGFAKQVTVDISSTKIIESKRNLKAIEGRIDLYEKDLNKLIGDRDREDTKNRLKFLSSKAAIITVGYSTEAELREKGDRVEDAMCAVKAANEEGYVPGGGLTLYKLSKMIDLSPLNEEYRFGAEILLGACRKPIMQILNNALEDTDKIFNKIDSEAGFDFGYNVDTEQYGSMLEMGIIDPKKVTRVALQNATTIALLLLTTDAIIADMPNAPSGWQPPAGYRLPGQQKEFNHKY